MSEEEKINFSIESMSFNFSIESMSFEEIRNDYILKKKQFYAVKSIMATMEARG